MTATASFGFECEMAEGAQELTASLWSAASAGNHQLIGMDHLHSYHCDCGQCTFSTYDDRPPFDLRAQNDSSCSGELISRIFTTMDEAMPVIQAIQDHAIEVDAIPGWDAGLHVHVGIRQMRSSNDRIDAFFEYLRFEPLLTYVAAGRWPMLRDNNTPVRNNLSGEIISWTDGSGRYRLTSDTAVVTRSLNLLREMSDFRYYKERLYSTHRDMDRHSYLNTRTRHDTWEFRVFNSSRSAWRIALAIGLSRAFVDPAFYTLLQRIADPTPTTATLEAFVAALETSGNGDTAALVARQIEYLVTRAANIPHDAFEMLAAS